MFTGAIMLDFHIIYLFPPEKSFHNDCKPSFASTNQGKESDPLHLTQSSNETAVPKAQCQSETFKPTGETSSVQPILSNNTWFIMINVFFSL